MNRPYASSELTRTALQYKVRKIKLMQIADVSANLKNAVPKAAAQKVLQTLAGKLRLFLSQDLCLSLPKKRRQLTVGRSRRSDGEAVQQADDLCVQSGEGVSCLYQLRTADLSATGNNARKLNQAGKPPDSFPRRTRRARWRAQGDGGRGEGKKGRVACTRERYVRLCTSSGEAQYVSYLVQALVK